MITTMNRGMRGAALGVTAAALLSAGLSACGTSQTTSQPTAGTIATTTAGPIVPVTFTAAQTAELKSLTDTPEKLQSVVATLNDSFGKTLRLVHANRTGIVIGRTEQPLVNSGDALIHIADVFTGDA